MNSRRRFENSQGVVPVKVHVHIEVRPEGMSESILTRWNVVFLSPSLRTRLMVCPDLSHLSMTSSCHLFHFLTIVSVACFEDNYKGDVQNKMRVLIIPHMHLTMLWLFLFGA